MRRRERGGKKGRRGGDETRGKHVWGKGGKGRKGVEETFGIVAGSEDVRLVVQRAKPRLCFVSSRWQRIAGALQRN